jgi:predicted Zn-dependent protease
VDSAKEADVVVRFHPGDCLPGKPATVGQTYSAVRGKYLAKAVMDLATGSRGIFRTTEHLTETAAHEWGHALGISGHSDNPRDLMFAVSTRYLSFEPFVEDARSRTPTERDVNTVKLGYADLFATSHKSK